MGLSELTLVWKKNVGVLKIARVISDIDHLYIQIGKQKIVIWSSHTSVSAFKASFSDISTKHNLCENKLHVLYN